MWATSSISATKTLLGHRRDEAEEIAAIVSQPAKIAAPDRAAALTTASKRTEQTRNLTLLRRHRGYRRSARHFCQSFPGPLPRLPADSCDADTREPIVTADIVGNAKSMFFEEQTRGRTLFVILIRSLALNWAVPLGERTGFT